MKTLKGICPIIAAPFTNSGELDLDSLKNLLRVLARGGCDALTLFGIAGEYYNPVCSGAYCIMTGIFTERQTASIWL